MHEPLNGWPFKTWKQGYILGILNGFLLGIVIASMIYVIQGFKL